MGESPFDPLLLQMLTAAAASENRDEAVEAFLDYARSPGKEEDDSVQYLVGMALAMLNRTGEALEILRPIAAKSDPLGKLASKDVEVIEGAKAE